MSFLDIFRMKKRTYSKWKELGSYQASFSLFGKDIYASDLVRDCIRPLASFTAKAEAKCSDSSLQKILNNRPNMYMSGYDFLYKVRTLAELTNNCFIYIQRDDKNNVVGFYPVPAVGFEALEYDNGLFIKFSFLSNVTRELVLPWADLAVVRKDYSYSDISGDDTKTILENLENLNTANQGASNAIKATANLRGILKSTKGMLAPEQVKKQKEEFVRDYLSLENKGGIAALDATQEFTPIKMEPITATYEQIKEYRENVYRYFGVNDNIVMSNMTPEQIEAFYEIKIEPFLTQLSNELTSKIYSNKALAYNNYVVYEANKLQFASLSKKIQMYKEVVLYGGMTVNEWRIACNMAPIDGGDERIMRLDAGSVDDNKSEEGEDE